MKNKCSKITKIGLVSLLSLAVVFSSGCEPLRKKFKRKSKEDKKREFIPVLDPIDYPISSISAEERYRYHYSLWRVWYKEYIISIDERQTDKRQKYFLTQLIMQLAEMRNWIGAEKEKGLEEMLEDARWVEGAYDQPAVMRNTYAMKKKMERVDRRVRNEYSPNDELEYKSAEAALETKP